MNKRIFFISIAAIIAAYIGICCITYRLRCKRLESAAEEHLSALCQTKKQLIENYFNELVSQTQVLAQDPITITAMQDFKTAFTSLAQKAKTMNLDKQKASLYLYYYDNFIRKLNFHLQNAKTVDDFFPPNAIGVLLQAAYIANNPYPVGQKEDLISAPEAEEYDAVHKKNHPFFKNILDKFKYYDIFLIDIISGNIYYSVQKEIDFANNLNQGALNESSLSYLIANLSKSSKPKVTDLTFYNPSYAAPAAFIAVPIKNKETEIGALALQIPIEQINSIMTNNKQWQDAGLGTTGEVYLIGKNLTMRSIARRIYEDKHAFLNNAQKLINDSFVISNMREFESTILLQKVNTKSAYAALAGKTGVMETTNYEGTKVLSAYAPLSIQGLQWAILAEQSLNEIDAPARRKMFIMLAGLLALLIGIIALLSYRTFRKSAPNKV